jgi:acetylornithine aminotransferase
LVDNAARVGAKLLADLRQIQGLKEVRGRGLMIGIDLGRSAKELRRHLIEVEHVFTGASGTDVIRLLPPLVLTEAQADDFLARFKRALDSGK